MEVSAQKSSLSPSSPPPPTHRRIPAGTGGHPEARRYEGPVLHHFQPPEGCPVPDLQAIHQADAGVCRAGLVPRFGPHQHAHLQRTQNAALRIATGLRLINPSSSPPCGDYGATPLLPPPQPHSHQSKLAHHTGVTLLNPSLFPSPTPLDQNAGIHQQSVSRHLESVPQNSLLGKPPRPISEEELLLPRLHLSRLRCGHHHSITAYKHRNQLDLDPSCRWCQEVPETVLHLFEECHNLVGHRNTANITFM